MKTSIISVNYYGDKYRDLLVESIKKNASEEVEILIHDNSSPNNIGHARGLNKLVKEAKGKYIFAFDIDAHVLLKDFDKKIIEYYEENKESGLRLIGGEGNMLKQVRPCCMFFEKEFFEENNMTFEPKEFEGVKFDVGVHFTRKTLSLGYKTSYFGYSKSEYKDVLGNDFLFKNERFCYHHWYATRWFNIYGKRVHDSIDGITWEEHQQSTNNLFNQINEKFNGNNS